MCVHLGIKLYMIELTSSTLNFLDGVIKQRFFNANKITITSIKSLSAIKLNFTISSLKCSSPEERTREYFQNLGQIVLKRLKLALLSGPYM